MIYFTFELTNQMLSCSNSVILNEKIKVWIYEKICLTQHSFSHWPSHQTFLQRKFHAHAFLMQIMEIISGHHGSQKVPEQSRKPYKTSQPQNLNLKQTF